MKQIFPYFSQNPLNRLDNQRGNKEKIEKLLLEQNTKFILFREKEIVLDENKSCIFTNEILSACEKEPKVFLGVYEKCAYFAINIKTPPSKSNTSNLRDIAEQKLLSEDKLGILAQAQAVLNWHATHQYCSKCGSKSISAYSGWRRDCLVCEAQHFPRTDPVVIMLVTFDEYCLLGRGVHFPPNRYSCLAGFMESGESIEDAARRELFEEAGVVGTEVSYIASQPWPFPTNLMIGLHVKAASKELDIDTNEIADARWFHKDEIKKILSGDESFGISTPKEVAIARNLLEWWIN